ncbi:glycosyltransferase 87 family protein [Catellatospora sp. KI3]|uniref:glycosyltransferase 87 family protein n=1 Tax=Catellatospora sp. KI3 TaxID=3041620 RepID=UPI0024828B63|nr:glycosyltransferase 87 family protein [Catellatospora sp. KI3]MDI1465877.1 glycosyltransferase 87 family protein [Catellatospora sp. KI3]
MGRWGQWTAARTAWAIYGLIAAVSCALVLLRPDRLSDLHIYYGAVKTAQSGAPLYGYVAENGGPFTYPPFAALVMWPMTGLSETALQLLWLASTCAAVAALALSLGRALHVPAHRRALAVAAVACAVLLSAPAQSNLRFGQVSVFIVLLALVDAAGLTPARWRGVLVGVAAAIKLTPLLFVLFFLLARRWRDAARAGAAFAGCALVAAALLPADSWTYWSGTVLQTSRIGDLASLGNQSVHGMLLRIGVAPQTLPLVWAALVALVCGTALLRARRLRLDGEPVRAAVLVGCATVAASPVSWTHHQLWTVLAAMLLVAARGALRRAAGVALAVVMTLSLGVLLGEVSTYPGVQFLLENARTLGVVATCLAGLGGAAALAVTSSRRPGRVWLRAVTATAAVLACFAVLPLPAGADPTFKAYAQGDTANPRYFYFCRTETACADAARTAAATGAVVRFGIVREQTKVRVNGVVDESVARLEFRSAPGGAPRVIPIVDMFGERGFSFRSANLAAGELTAYAEDGTALAAYSAELTP